MTNHPNRSMSGKPRIVRRDKLSGVLCICGEFMSFGAWGIAQLASGHEINRTCDCGVYFEITPSACGRHNSLTKWRKPNDETR